MNEIISEQKSHILRPIAMIFYFMVCALTMSIVEVIVHDKVPGMKHALFHSDVGDFMVVTVLRVVLVTSCHKH